MTAPKNSKQPSRFQDWRTWGVILCTTCSLSSDRLEPVKTFGLNSTDRAKRVLIGKLRGHSVLWDTHWLRLLFYLVEQRRVRIRQNGQILFLWNKCWMTHVDSHWQRNKFATVKPIQTQHIQCRLIASIWQGLRHNFRVTCREAVAVQWSVSNSLRSNLMGSVTGFLVIVSGQSEQRYVNVSNLWL